MHSKIRDHLEKEQDHNIHENVDIVEKDMCSKKNYVQHGGMCALDATREIILE